MRERGVHRLEDAEAWALLERVDLGRLGVTVGSLPLIVPLHFACDGTDLVFGVEPYSPLVTALDNTVVAFEAGGHDAEADRWWTVAVRGVASLLAPGLELPAPIATPAPDDLRGARLTPRLVVGAGVPSRDDVPAMAAFLASVRS
jgi:hypothetical protein